MPVVPKSLVLPSPEFIHTARLDPTPATLPNARWFIAQAAGDGLAYIFPKGTLAAFAFLTADILLNGAENAAFAVRLHEAGSERAFTFHFGLLNSFSARIVLPLAALAQSNLALQRHGAILKPHCSGDRIDLLQVDRVTLTVLRAGPQPVRFCVTPFMASVTEPPPLTNPLLPKGQLVDQLGQSTLHDWPTKTHSVDEVAMRLREQSGSAINQKWPDTFSKYGGFGFGPRLDATGYFRLHQDGKRHWFIDPEGHLFFSAGMDGINPRANAHIEDLEKSLAWLPDFNGPYQPAFGHPFNPDRRSFSFLIANLIRAFGPQAWYQHWSKIAISQLRSFGCNTFANGSEWHTAKNAAFPYVRSLQPSFPNTPVLFRDFPDVFHPNFAGDADRAAQQLGESKDDPAMIGYFILHEPAWAADHDTPATSVLRHSPAGSEARKALAEFLRQRYGTNERLSDAWGAHTTYISLVVNPWMAALNDAAQTDLTAFSAIMAERLFRTLSEACKRNDPNHLNLGARFPALPPDWSLDAMRCFDAISFNSFTERVPADQLAAISANLARPVLIAGFHFGSLDAGLPGSGHAHVRSQRDRGRAYRVYLESAAACPACVGAHYFQMYDQPALGRFDGENYQIGFVDTTNRPYEDLVFPARESHTRMYAVALGQEPPFSDAPDYLPPLFI